MASRPVRPLKVLIVDDDATTLTTLSALLEDLGYEVQTRSDVLGTSSVVLREKPDMILLDIDMPALRGDQLAHLLSADARLAAPSLIVHSSLPTTKLAEIAGSCKAIGFIAKTSDDDSFLRSFDEMVKRHFARPASKRP